MTVSVSKKLGWISLLLIVALLVSGGSALAQDTPQGPIYIVQAGDTLWSIAQRFGVSMDALAQANNIADASQLGEGAHLIIPGLTGVNGTLITVPVTYGESLFSLSRRYHVPSQALARLNRLTSPAELYAGSELIIPQEQVTPSSSSGRAALNSGQTLLELAALHNTDPWALAATNNLSNTWSTLPGEALLAPGGTADGPWAFPAPISAVQISAFPPVQGKTVVIRLTAPEGLTLNGDWMGHSLHFFFDGNGEYIALQGVHALAEPGLYPLRLTGTLPDGTPFDFSQSVPVRSGEYAYEKIQVTDEVTLDPAVTRPEDEQWFALVTPVTPQKLWDGLFKNPSPIPLSEGFPSVYGTRRSYNGSAYTYFHSGLDMYGQTGFDIYAPAAGRVVFTGALTVRGNATIIDHGWGVYSAYMHQSEIRVQVGDHVEPGQVIGLVGATGRVNGPHLHFEIWAGGVQVDPLDWLTQVYP